MHDQLDRQLTHYKEEIQPILELDLSDLNSIERGITISQKYLHDFRRLIRDGQFKTEEQEIDFFKRIKPYIHGRLKFLVKLTKFQISRPKGTLSKQRTFLDECIRRLEYHYNRNMDFVSYYRRGDTKLDKYYFVRGKDRLFLASDTTHYYTDPDFSTSHDHTVAKIIAYDLLIQFYREELDHLRKKELSQPDGGPDDSSILDKVSWTATKTDLVELIYALKTTNAIQNGNADIKTMAMICEKLFDLDLGNVYRTYLEIKERKHDRTSFLTKLKIDLEHRMKEDDERY
jgi:hypothetical protein